MSQPYGVARTQSGASATSAIEQPVEPACAHERVRRRGASSGARRGRPSRGGSPTATSAGSTRSVRRRTPRRAASTQEPEHAGEERQRCRLRTDRPAPGAGEHGEEADHERRPGRRPAGPGRSGNEPEREHDEQDVEHDDGSHPGKLVRAVEEHLGEPLLIRPRRALAEKRERLRAGSPFSTTSRPAMSVSHVSPTTSAGPKTVRSTTPTSETSRIGKGLDSRAPRSPASRRGARRAGGGPDRIELRVVEHVAHRALSGGRQLLGGWGDRLRVAHGWCRGRPPPGRPRDAHPPGADA